MQKPFIGLTTSNGRHLNKYPISLLLKKYVEAVLGAGGMPVLIPSADGMGKMAASLISRWRFPWLPDDGSCLPP